MKILFEDPALKELFELGRTKRKPYSKLPSSVIKQYVRTVNKIRYAERIESLYLQKSLHYEKKVGDMRGCEVVWINEQYRLHFTSYKDNETLLISTVGLEKITKHYGD